jgi:ubiquinone/menaquinone biosynthesis C-methylase UbiE
MYPTASTEDIVHAHYARPKLSEVILNRLKAAGKNVDALTPDDLVPLDEFHVRGRQATIELAAKLELKPGQQVLDVGSGLGGSARYLASQYGCLVTGLDLIEDYSQAASMLAERLGMSAKVTFRTGNALDMPFEDGSFDRVWTQHTSMNIADKEKFYAEIRRVLRPGGLLGLYDILAGPGGLVHFPVPWGRDPSISFLIPPPKLRALLEQNGLRVTSWSDTSAAGQTWFTKMAERAGQPGIEHSVGLHVLLGPEFREMAQNMVRNLAEQRVILIECVARL